MKTFTIKDIRSWKPCYDPIRHLPEDWSRTAIDLLNLNHISFEDRLWVVLRPELVSERIMRLFAVWCYRQTLIFLPNQDPRCIEAANVAERFANGEATKAELKAAESAAWYAAWSAAESAAESAAWYAARAAAESAQRDKLIEMIQEENKSL